MRIAILIGVTLLSGCATVMNGSTQSVKFDTKAGGGTLKLYDSALYHIKPVYEGSLPATVELTRDKIYKYDVTRDGYKSKTAVLKPSMSGWEAVSDAIPLFSLVDTVSGGGRKFDNEVVIPLDTLPPSASNP